MHKLGEFIQTLMDEEGMKQSELARRSGLSRSHIHFLLKSETLSRLPKPETFDGLHKAFPAVTRETLVLIAANAMGIPVEARPAEMDYSKLTDETLIGLLAERLKAKATGIA